MTALLADVSGTGAASDVTAGAVLTLVIPLLLPDRGAGGLAG